MDIEQLEGLGLAEDRAKALAQLIPGTEEYYFYHCIDHQHKGQLEESEKLLRGFVDRYGWSARAREIQARQRLLCYEEDPQAALSFLRDELSLRFDHQREAESQAPHYPTALPPTALAWEVLAEEALSYSHGLEGFQDSALPRLAPGLSDPEKRRELLRRISRPDFPGLVDLILAELDDHRSGGFGSLPIHQKLLLSQVDALIQKRPSLQENPAFIDSCIQKLRPDPDTDWENEEEAREVYLARLWKLAEPLVPAFNGLKSHILYHLLELGRRRGLYERGLFLTYLTLPRLVAYARPEYYSQPKFQGSLVRPGQARYPTGLPQVGDDEPLAREYLSRFLLDADNFDEYKPYVREDYLREVFATTKILAGAGDPERWYSMLGDPTRYQALKERVDIDLAPQNPPSFGARDGVVLEVDIKNVSNLVVKVFEINARNYYLLHKREVDTAIDLDGLVASTETTYCYDEPPLLRVRRTFRFDDLTRPGIFVVEFIGNGKSSRALISKGSLRYLERRGAAGHVFHVLNEEGEILPDASIWLGGRVLQADEKGAITIPYSTSPGRTSILLCHQELTSLAHFDHQAESYSFSAGIYLDREQLLGRKSASVVLRPTLLLNGVPVSLSLVERPRLVIETTTRQGVSARLEAPVSLSSEEETVHTFQVPEDLSTIFCTVQGKVRSVTGEDREIELADGAPLRLNGIDSIESIEDIHLAYCQEGYVLYLLGKTGEPKPAAPLHLSLRHRDFTREVELTLQTDEEGRVLLGALQEIDQLSARSPRGAEKRFLLGRDRCRYPGAVHAAAGEVIALPYVGRCREASSEGFSLLAQRGDTYVRDLLRALRVEGGRLLIEGLPPGDYELYLKESSTLITLAVAAGQRRGGWVVGAHRMLEARAEAKLSIKNASLEGEELVLRLGGSSSSARVHVVASRFVPESSLFAALGSSLWPEGRQGVIVKKRALYASGRDIGDEYRYILDRKQAKKYPGNTLERPGLLLNPWALRSTTTGQDTAKEGGAYAAMPLAGGLPPSSVTAGNMLGGGFGGQADNSSSLEFLPKPSVVLPNLRPDGEGVLRVERALFGEANLIRVLAVDRVGAVERWVALPEVKAAPRDLCLRDHLDPEGRFTEQKQISILRAGESLVIEDITTSALERYDTLSGVYRLLLALSGDKTLAEFSFLLEWPELDEEKKRARYSEYACHELSFFLYCKDRPFFDRVVAPYLRNKKHKTFLDHYLLGDDLGGYTRPWAFGRLNIVEQILLSRAIEAERGPVARLAQDRFDLMPPDPAAEERLFQTALGSSALEEADSFGFVEAKEEASLKKRAAPAKKAGPVGRARGAPPPPARPAPAAAPAAAPFGASFDVPAVASPPPPGAPPGAPVRTRTGSILQEEEQDDISVRAEVRRLYRATDKTKEWAENNYYKRRVQEQGPELVKVNAFWRDFAAHDPQKPFVSRNFAQAASHFTEVALALAVLDLPFTAEKHEASYQGARLTLGAKSQVVVFHKEIKPAGPAKAPPPILVSQNYFRRDDRHRFEGNERFENYVTGELLVHTIYTCQVVLTNPTSSPQKLELLLQIPKGALPVANGFYTRSQHLRLSAYATQAIEYSFYFPAPGVFDHFPVNVSIREESVARGEPGALTVARELSEVDTESWSYLSQRAESAAVLEYLERANLSRLDLEKIAWRMKESSFFHAALSILSRRHVYHRILWSYGVLHNEPLAVRELLLHEDSFLRRVGLSLRSPLVEIEPVARGWYEHLEYSPLVNARAHRLKAQIKILNEAFAAQYQNLLRLLCYQPAPTHEQLLSASYYLLLQDRIEDALKTFDRVDPAKLSEKLQYDYVRLYVALYREEHALAHQIASSYASYPVDRWRRRFESALAVLEEAKGEPGRVIDTDDRAQEQAHLASTEPGLDFTIEKHMLTLRYQNLRLCQVRYYLMDIELLFSRQPFVQQGSDRFSIVRPNHSEAITLPAGQHELTVELPKELRGRNVVVEVVAEGIRRAQAHYAHSLSIQVIEPYGQVRVRHHQERAPLPRCYVKVFTRRTDGSVSFYKDGYTDLRGVFDYASVSTNELDHVERFALLFMSDEHGATISEAAPPAR